jgi:hypothetical protein
VLLFSNDGSVSIAQAVSSEAARTLQQLQSQLEALPQPRQATGHSHRMCWALAPPAHATAGGEPQRFPDNCIDGDLLVRALQPAHATSAGQLSADTRQMLYDLNLGINS